MSLEKKVRTGQSLSSDARQAVRDFHASVQQPEMALVIFFCSSRFDLEIVADELRQCFGDTPVVGCTTAGEIGPLGYCEESLAGASFPAGAFSVTTGLLCDLQQFDIAGGQSFAGKLLQQAEAKNTLCNAENTFGFMMIDGMSIREEAVVRTIKSVLGGIELIGGSAGDDLNFAKTWVYHDGAFHTDAALVILVSTELPFKVFKTQHFITDAERLVVTEADPERRIVKEINGLPAVEEYARVIGADPDDLGAFSFASSPVVVVIDGTDYVRSIQKANPDGSLTFFCAIEEGLVLRVAHGEGLVAKLKDTLALLEQALGTPQLVLACDCILRRLEIGAAGLNGTVGDLFKASQTVGFATYGEQFGGVHINQTLTGIAIGQSKC